jgi:nucleotide-binding universal stress UspA family protein
MLNKILVAIDDSPTNRVVFTEALTLAHKTGASLMLLHVLTPDERNNPELPRSYIPYYYPIITDELIKQYHEEWEAAENRGLSLLRSLTHEATQVGVSVEYSQNVGEPSRVICDFAKDWQADLIVTGRRGRSGLSELLMGSVSNYVTHHAHCSVWVVQGKVRTEATKPEEQAIAV